MSPPEARSHCYLNPLSHRKIDTHPLWSGSITKSDTLPFSFIWIHLSAHPHIKLYFKPSFTVCRMSSTYYLCELIFPDVHKNAMVFSWESTRLRFGLVTRRLSAAHSTPRPLTHFTPSEWEKTSTKHETDHRMDRNSSPAAMLSFCWRKWALPFSQTHLAALSPKWDEHC